MPPTLLLGVCDHSTAAATPDLLEALRRTHDVKVILTEGCKVFLPSAPEGAVDDAQEWYQWQKVGDDVLHIELTRWADCLLVAPLSANYLAKVANGLCDDLLTSVIRAWPPEKPVVLCPAMHELMRKSAHTATQLHVLRKHENYRLLLNGMSQRGDAAQTELSDELRAYEVADVVAAVGALK